MSRERLAAGPDQELQAAPAALALAAVVAERVAARQQARQIVADAQAALRHSLGDRRGGPSSLDPEGVPAMTFPIPRSPFPTMEHPGGKTPMQIAQELADAAMAASEEGIRAAMAAAEKAIEAANEAARLADEAAAEAVRRAAEANAK
ncbi:hypothetical protein [uncultured Stenotrophomonas sp.]|nr:hypothetical protein [uncultured Stenotrophomonas sp.]